MIWEGEYMARQRTVIAAITLLLAACSGPEEPSAALAGTYDLASVDSQPLPYQLKRPDGTAYMEIIAAILTLDARGGVTLVSTHRRYTDPEPQVRSDTIEGAYTVAGDDVIVTAPEALPMRFTRMDDGLSITAEGRTMLFVRRN